MPPEDQRTIRLGVCVTPTELATLTKKAFGGLEPPADMLPQTVRQQTAPVSAKARVYLENYGDYRASGPGSGMHQLCEMANGLNVAASLDTAYPRVAPEWIVAENPDIILKLSGKTEGYGLQDAALYNQLRDRMAARPAWAHIQAVKDGRVHVMNGAMMSGPRAAIALAYMAKWI